MIIKTKRFVLRPLKLSDTASFFEVMQDKDTQKSLMSYPKNISEAKKEVQQMLKEVREKDSEIFSIEINGKYAGNVILQHQNWDPKSNEGRAHLWVHPKYRGKGIATEALSEIVHYGLKKKFKRIFAQCKANNKAVIKVIKKCGFKKVKSHLVEGIEKILWVREKI